MEEHVELLLPPFPELVPPHSLVLRFASSATETTGVPSMRFEATAEAAPRAGFMWIHAVLLSSMASIAASPCSRANQF